MEAAALLLVLLAGGCSRTPDRWNLLIITVDTLRADRLGCYGSDQTRTPGIDALATEGTLFTNSFSSIPITLPSHCSILTGLYPRTHQVLSHGYRLDDRHTTLAEMLDQEGYQTAAFVWNHVLSRKYGLNQGFDIYWERFLQGSRMANELMNSTGEDILTTAAIDWVRTVSEEPFFLWVHWFHPHKPYQPPPPMDAVYGKEGESPTEDSRVVMDQAWQGEIDLPASEVDRFRRLYGGEVAYSDRQVGLLLEQLRREGLLDRTLIVFTADHGEVLYEHDRYFGHDIMLYDPSIHVPLILRGPGLIPEGGLVEETVRNVDIVPTLLDLLGVPAEEFPLDGRSFAPTLRGAKLEDAPVFAELFPPEEEWKSLPRHAIRYGDWKLIAEDQKEEVELYRLSDDPGEMVNLAATEEETRARLETMLRGWMGDEVPASFPDLSAEERENLRSLGYIGD